MALDKGGLLQARGLKKETVKIPSLGDDVVLRELSLAEWLECNKRFAGLGENDQEGMFKAALAQVATALCNPDGSSMFEADEIEQTADALMGQPAVVANELIAESNRIQGVAKDPVREAVGNSEGIPSGSTSSDSPETQGS